LLQIENDWIYYREFDEIHRIRLNNSKLDYDIKTDELLCKDKDIIPNVHHIFWAKKSKLKVEYVKPKYLGLTR
jgi:hypothetical protein